MIKVKSIPEFLLSLMMIMSTFAAMGSEEDDKEINGNEHPVPTTPGFNFDMGIYSQHIWRGTATSYAPSIEPSISYTHSNITAGIWAAQSINGDYTELDLFLSYQLKNFTFTLYDYYCPPALNTRHQLFNFEQKTTWHSIDVNLEYGGTEKFPFSFLLATMIYGDDRNPVTQENYYSTYFQMGYDYTIQQHSFSLFMGVSPQENYYGHRFGIVNAGITASSRIKLKNTIAVPFEASIITNPMANNLYLVVGFSL